MVDAVYAFAHALHKAWTQKCRSPSAHRNNGHRVCRELKELDGGDFYKNYLLNVDFIGECTVCAGRAGSMCACRALQFDADIDQNATILFTVCLVVSAVCRVANVCIAVCI